MIEELQYLKCNSVAVHEISFQCKSVSSTIPNISVSKHNSRVSTDIKNSFCCLLKYPGKKNPSLDAKHSSTEYLIEPVRVSICEFTNVYLCILGRVCPISNLVVEYEYDQNFTAMTIEFDPLTSCDSPEGSIKAEMLGLGSRPDLNFERFCSFCHYF